MRILVRVRVLYIAPGICTRNQQTRGGSWHGKTFDTFTPTRYFSYKYGYKLAVQAWILGRGSNFYFQHHVQTISEAPKPAFNLMETHTHTHTYFDVLLTVHCSNDQFLFQLMHHNFPLLTKSLYMFRAPTCPSSGGQTIHVVQLHLL